MVGTLIAPVGCRAAVVIRIDEYKIKYNNYQDNNQTPSEKYMTALPLGTASVLQTVIEYNV